MLSGILGNKDRSTQVFQYFTVVISCIILVILPISESSIVIFITIPSRPATLFMFILVNANLTFNFNLTDPAMFYLLFSSLLCWHGRSLWRIHSIFVISFLSILYILYILLELIFFSCYFFYLSIHTYYVFHFFISVHFSLSHSSFTCLHFYLMSLHNINCSVIPWHYFLSWFHQFENYISPPFLFCPDHLHLGWSHLPVSLMPHLRCSTFELLNL